MSVCEFIANYFCCCICVNRKNQKTHKNEKKKELKDIEKNDAANKAEKPKEEKGVNIFYPYREADLNFKENQQSKT